jgi:hypothetical protein
MNARTQIAGPPNTRLGFIFIVNRMDGIARGMGR